MAIYQGNMEITKTIKIIEQLKSQLLSNVSMLFSNMTNGDNNKENIDILADMIILSYLLTNKLGISSQALDIKVLNKLKIALIENDSDSTWKQEIGDLLRHIDKTRELN